MQSAGPLVVKVDWQKIYFDKRDAEIVDLYEYMFKIISNPESIRFDQVKYVM